MTDLIRTEAYEIFIMFYAGLAIMMIMELKNMLCNGYELNGRLRVFIELFTWLLAAYLFGSFAYACAYGRMSLHGIGATIVGAVLWKKYLYGIIPSLTLKEVQKPATH